MSNSQKMIEREEYRKVIQKLALKRINKRVPNGAPEHAAILMEAMFANADSNMRIFSKRLNDTVYSNERLVDSIERFFRKPHARLRILLQEKPADTAQWAKNHKLFQRLNLIGNASDFNAKVQVRFAKGNYTSENAKHFSVMDKQAYRYETNHEKCEAIANFNESSTAKELAEAFDLAFNIARENDIPLENQ